MTDDAVELLPFPSRRKMLLLEIASVMTLYWVPITVSSTYSFFVYGPVNSLMQRRTVGTFWIDAVRDACPMLIILFVLWSSGDDLRIFGLGTGRKWSGILAIPAFFLLRADQWFITQTLQATTGKDGDFISTVFSSPFRHGSIGLSWIVSVFVFTGASAFAQEFVMRGYLIPRLQELTKRPWLAYSISLVAFASFHLYQGIAGLCSAFIAGIIFTVLYGVSKSIWPGVLAHWASNLVIYLAFLAAVARYLT